MRVIAGSARSVPLKTLSTYDIRPTSDRNKETLFNILSPDIGGCTFLDLFSGSGAIGIEALSRGALKCDFVEKNRRAVSVIEENLRKTKLYENAEIIVGSIPGILGKLAGRKYDIIFMDPPFKCGLERDALIAVRDLGLLNDNGYAVVEASLSDDTPLEEDTGFSIYRTKEYKNVKHIFLRLDK